MTEWYEIKWNGYDISVYDTQDIIKTVCDLVNGYGANPDEIEIITHKRKGQV